MFEASEELLRSALRGIAEVGNGAHGLTLHRVPARFAMYHDVDSLTQTVANQASGARLAFETKATLVEIEYRATRDRNVDGSYVGPESVITFTSGESELSVSSTNGDLRVWNGVALERLETGSNSVARFELEAAQTPRTLDIWLPHNCDIELVAVRADQALVSALRDQKHWVHYGSSISHSMEATEPVGVWPVVAARRLNLDLFSLGLAGSANLEQFASRVIAQQPADLISLKLGINPVNGRNMTRRTFVPAVHSFIDTIRDAKPEVPIVLISPIYCEAHEEVPGPSSGGLDGKVVGASNTATEDWVQDLTLKMIRADLESIVARRSDANLHYLNGLQLFGEADFHLMPDGLHPNAQGYLLIGERFASYLASSAITY